MTLDHEHYEPAIYEITVKGSLDSTWSEWFDGLTVIAKGDGETVLVGRIRDQAALYGVLGKVRDMGLPLLSVVRIDDPASAVE